MRMTHPMNDSPHENVSPHEQTQRYTVQRGCRIYAERRRRPHENPERVGSQRMAGCYLFLVVCPTTNLSISGSRAHIWQLQKILAEIQKVLLNQTCSASGDILNREEIDKYPGQSPESSIEVRIAKPLDLTCPHVDCKDTERVIYTKKPNLLRHYQSRESFHSKC
jgi:hypothetical protein